MTLPATSSDELAACVARLVGPDGPRARFAIEERRVEYDAIVELLLQGVTPGVDRDEAETIAACVAAGCLGEQHLWRDLELPNRRLLRTLLETYFEPFAADNTMDMRWKKYIYRKLCRWGGFNTCPAPSCAVCPDYADCFGAPSVR